MRVKGSFDNSAAQTQVSVVEYRILTRGDGSLRPGEIHSDSAIVNRLNCTVLIGLAVACFYAAFKGEGRRACYPVQVCGCQAVAEQGRMVMSLGNRKSIIFDVFGYHVPGFFRVTLHPADAQAPALSQGVEVDPRMLAYSNAVDGTDRAGSYRAGSG